MNDRDAYIALNMMRGVGPVTVRTLATALGSPARIMDASDSDLRAVPGAVRDVVDIIIEKRRAVDPLREIERAAALGAHMVAVIDEEYPRPLAAIHDPPMALYVKGTLELRDKHAVAIVGSRQTTNYGIETAERMAFLLAQNGITVVSGLARGIDSAAHRGALKGKGRTLAVLGGALDRFFPPENQALGGEIAGSGAVITEFPLGREPDKTTFPVRNRIVSGLSMGVLVVEASATSGAMITARQALEQGRQVFAVPGRVDSGTARGAHALIKGGAKLVETVDDILEEFEMLIPRQAAPQAVLPRPPLSADEQKVADALAEHGQTDLDSLTRQTGLTPAAMNALLVVLEMKRVIRMLPGRIIALRRDT